MSVRERVIKGLECCMGEGQCCGMCDNCPYNTDRMRCNLATLHQEALELLKAQDPAKPVKVNRYMDTDENGDWYVPETYDCGNCGVELHDKANYCHSCGKKVKWGG